MLGRRLGRYEVVQAIGAGGMGEVYRARDEHLERDVALKVLPPGAIGDEEARRRFRQEALALSRLNHPNIATIHDFCTEAGADFLVMEYVEGTTLSARIATGPLQEREITQLGVQIAEGLAAAHRHGIVHRDIKPENVRITPDGRAKLLDFGVAQLVRHDAADAVTAETVGQLHTTAGTLPYMAPEQLQAEPVDARTDIHGVGAVLYEMATGERPFREQVMAKLVDAILHRPPAPPSTVNPRISAELERIIGKCLEKDPENRYQSAKELAVDLRRLGSPTTSTGVVLRPRRAKPKWALAAAATGALAVVAVLLIRSVDRNDISVGPAGALIESVVILPSQVFAGEGDGFLADAIPSLLSTQLAQVREIDVRAPPTAVDFERVDRDLNRIVEAYGTDGLVLSSVNAQADRLMLNVQLVDADSRRVIWSEEFSEDRQKYIELVRVAAEGLRAVLRPEAAATSGPAVASSGETELLLQRGRYYARFYSYRKQRSDFDLALAAFERVLAQEASAAAAAGIAGLHVARIEAGAPLPDALTQIDEWAERALEIDARSAEAWRLLSIAEEFRPEADRRKRIEYGLKAAWLAPRSGPAQHALATALARNSFRLALAALDEAARLDPLQLNSRLAASGALALLGRPQEALPLIDQVLQIEPGILVGHLVKGFVLLAARRLDDASAVLEPLEPHVAAGRLHPGWYRFAREWLAFEVATRDGDRQRADTASTYLLAAARGEGQRVPQWESLTLHVVLVLARHGRVDEALQTLEARFAAGVVEPYDLLMQNPDLERVRGRDRFPAIAARSRVKFEELSLILHEARDRREFPSYLEQPLLDLFKLPGLERLAS